MPDPFAPLEAAEKQAIHPVRVVIGPGNHIPAGDHVDDDGWRPILCGGGITNPSPEVTVPEADVCADCMQVVTDAGHPLGKLAEQMVREMFGDRHESQWVRNLSYRSMLRLLGFLQAAGWGPCASRCRHHDGMCSGIVDANEALGEEVVRLRGLLADALDLLEPAHKAGLIGDGLLKRIRAALPREAAPDAQP